MVERRVHRPELASGPPLLKLPASEVDKPTPGPLPSLATTAMASLRCQQFVAGNEVDPGQQVFGKPW
ncbi:hypothetical protein PLANPX_2431 [Lacipirellula parvula]|uniref:Uncharacterized protein n=1 Tax=Lacipirellula parvula TaxID=2650471 RepID=A0A5K7XIU3_9BACT|nr:hypothetical protein PLANPX_2431 [Lacipirellula parvula]